MDRSDDRAKYPREKFFCPTLFSFKLRDRALIFDASVFMGQLTIAEIKPNRAKALALLKRNLTQGGHGKNDVTGRVK